MDRIVSEARARGERPNLRGADLSGADLRGANLSGADQLLRFDGLPSGQATLKPTPQGWTLTVGGWSGTVQGLRGLIARNEWPEAKGDEQDHRPETVAIGVFTTWVTLVCSR